VPSSSVEVQNRALGAVRSISSSLSGREDGRSSAAREGLEIKGPPRASSAAAAAGPHKASLLMNSRRETMAHAIELQQPEPFPAENSLRSDFRRSAVR
jgi:hypothetical protein